PHRHVADELLRLPPGQHVVPSCGGVLLPLRRHRYLVRLLPPDDSFRCPANHGRQPPEGRQDR
ncbi:unnamed protein product, partial [Ectocarpus sp. 13 AM-2016]